MTVTENEHESVRWRASVTVHVTGVAPTANVDPLGGTHATVTGWAPLTVVGVPYTTEIGAPSVDWTGVGTGHVIFGGSGTAGGGGVGWVCDPLQAWSARAAASAVSTRR